MLEPQPALHLHFQQRHRLLGGSVLVAPRPKHSIEVVVHRFELRRIKAVERIARRIRPKTGCSTPGNNSVIRSGAL